MSADPVPSFKPVLCQLFVGPGMSLILISAHNLSTLSYLCMSNRPSPWTLMLMLLVVTTPWSPLYCIFVPSHVCCSVCVFFSVGTRFSCLLLSSWVFVVAILMITVQVSLSGFQIHVCYWEAVHIWLVVCMFISSTSDIFFFLEWGCVFRFKKSRNLVKFLELLCLWPLPAGIYTYHSSWKHPSPLDFRIDASGLHCSVKSLCFCFTSCLQFSLCLLFYWY